MPFLMKFFYVTLCYSCNLSLSNLPCPQWSHTKWHVKIVMVCLCDRIPNPVMEFWSQPLILSNSFTLDWSAIICWFRPLNPFPNNWLEFTKSDPISISRIFFWFFISNWAFWRSIFKPWFSFWSCRRFSSIFLFYSRIRKMFLENVFWKNSVYK